MILLRIVVLGSGSIVPTMKRFSTSFLVEYSGGKILLDTGPGTVERLRRVGVNPNEVGKIFVTHFHIDHVLDLPAMIKIRLFDEKGGPEPSPRRLDVYGPVGLKDFLDKLISEKGAFSYLSEMMRHSKYLYLHEVWEGLVEESEGFRAYSTPVEHYNGVAYRLELDGISIAYSGDTTYDERMVKLAEGVDLLIHECSFPKGSLVGKHVSEEELAMMVERIRPRAVVVSHLYPAWEGREDEIVDKIRGRAGCKVYVVRDMDILQVSP